MSTICPLVHSAIPVDHHQPELGHLLNRVARTFTPDPRPLHTTVRHLVDPEGGNVVHDHSTHFHLSKCPHNPVKVLGEYSHLEAKLTRVSHTECFGKIIVGCYRDYRSKYFLTNHSHARFRVDNK